MLWGKGGHATNSTSLKIVGTQGFVILFLSFCVSEIFHNNLLERHDSEVHKKLLCLHLEYFSSRTGICFISQVRIGKPRKIMTCPNHTARSRVKVIDNEENLPLLQCFTAQRHFSVIPLQDDLDAPSWQRPCLFCSPLFPFTLGPWWALNKY